MNELRTIPTADLDKDLLERLKSIAKPGVVFSQPIRQGGYSVMTASEYTVGKHHFSARPVALILLKPGEVEVRKFYNLPHILGTLIPLSAIIVWAVVTLFHPPWRQDGLLDGIRKLLDTMRGRTE